MPEDQLSNTERALWAAPPHALAGTAVTVITKTYGAASVDVMLADYRLDYLAPVASERPAFRMDGTPAGRAFASQEPVLRPPADGGTWDLHLPLSVHGDRLGVLTVSRHDEPGRETRQELVALAAVLSRALKIADAGTDVYRRARRRNRLTLAAEIQWDLLPGRSQVSEDYHLAGQLEPAYSIWGDNFDWAAGADHLIVTVTNGMGRGVEAALLTQLTVGALRNARRSGADLVDQATLANETVYTQHHGQRHVSTLLLRFDLETGAVAAIDAGSPKMFRMRGSIVEPIALEAQLPLGMFEDTGYSEQEFAIERGDRLVIFSDGFHAAVGPHGEPYGSSALAAALRQTRLQNPSEAVRTLTRGLLDYYEGDEIADDAVVLCLDWNGRGSPL
ncbi:PP2C family protein-serine/threonine phosphatase [Actinomadura sp. DC4]|uniref:PP2C family protein-serine/threonine phosphatase n=1 Tax=Actinomadura sp. DC4 TaxID=3055069 RepID=UPI0025B168D3|nr:PP2C family protein-serine/threonine phosphatase [Actinomadura sp. DC4]MDN3358256.1 PP2C family protein-serine/threonine phosphatase [Actinomadura sp. DC4]